MARSCNYIDAKTFGDFKQNQEKMIEVLNHNMTELSKQSSMTARSNIKLSNDVQWLKKIMGIQTGVMTGTFIALLGIVIKLVIGG
jgi:hypothetical protein